MLRAILLFLFLLSSCSGPSETYLQRQSRQKQKEMIEALKQIETACDFKASSKKLEKLFQDLVVLMEQAAAFQQKNGPSYSLEDEDREISKELQAQLARVAMLPGGLEMIEQAQLEAVLRLQKIEEK